VAFLSTVGLFKRRPKPGNVVLATCDGATFEGVIVSQMPDRTPILAHVDRAIGKVEQLPLISCKVSVVPEETIARRHCGRSTGGWAHPRRRSYGPVGRRG
jgi:hypothetical protein